MAKSPENMTPDERLKRIRSLERKVRDLERDKQWAERDEASVRHWAEEAWAEVRRLHDMCTLHWNEKQEIRKAAGLEPEPQYVPLAQFNHDTRQWEPIDTAHSGQPEAPDDRRIGPADTDIEAQAPSTKADTI